MHERRLARAFGHVLDERSVDLDRIEREAAQVAERRIASTEVVDCDAHSQPAKRAEPIDGGRRVGHQDAFGDLQGEACGVKPTCPQGCRDRCLETRLEQLARGEVDAQIQRRPSIAIETHHGPARFAEHPCSELHDQAGLLGEGDEFGWGDESPGAAVPTHQRLHADDTAARQRDDRLVEHAELTCLHRSTQLALELQPTNRALVEIMVEERDRATAARLGFVHRQVGAAHRISGAVHAGPSQADPHAGRQRQLAAAGNDRLAHSLEQPLGDRQGLAFAADGIEQHRELVAREPGDGVLGAHGRGQPSGGLHQHLIADQVPKAVVDAFEGVDIEEQHRRGRSHAAPANQTLVEPIAEQRAVGESGQRIVQCRVKHLARSGGVRDGQAGVIGKGDECLPLRLTVAPSDDRGGHHEAADGLAILADRSAGGGPHAEPGQRRQGGRMVEIVLDHDHPVLLQSEPTGSGTHGPARDLLERVQRDAVRSHHSKDARHVWVEEAQADELATDQLGNAGHDHVENFGQRRPVCDHALDGRECLQKPLALADLGRLPLAGAPRRPLALEQTQVAKRQVHDSSHTAQQGPFLAAEWDVAGTSDDNPHLVVVTQPAGGGAAAAQSRDLDRVLAGRDPLQQPARHGTRRKADLCCKPATDHDRGDFGLDRIRYPLHCQAHHCRTARRRTDGGEELGELLGRPAVQRGHLQLMASTTRVWLWKPDTPLVRAISPYV